MDNFEPKKLLILRILDILTENSDQDHPMKQVDILRELATKYAIECERKAISRNIDFLTQAGYDIVTTSRGSYLATRKFEVSELRLLIDSVLASRNICARHTRELVDKLASEGGKIFNNYARCAVNLDDFQKSDNVELFLNIEVLNEAIEKNRKVEFDYNSYGIDKKLHHRRADKMLVNPYQLIMKNGKYYLICNYDNYNNINYCHIDLISNVTITKQSSKFIQDVEGYENGLNIGKITNRLPYLFDDTPTRIEFIIGNNLINDIIDWFGFDVDMTTMPDEKIKVSLIASVRAMRFWILQYGRYVKVLSPQSLIDTIKEDITEMRKLYFDVDPWKI